MRKRDPLKRKISLRNYLRRASSIAGSDKTVSGNEKKFWHKRPEPSLPKLKFLENENTNGR